jgi:hypothetical protein
MEMVNPLQRAASPMRLLEMLQDRFGVFEAVANSTIQLTRSGAESDLAMDLLVAQAVLEFGDDLRTAAVAAKGWADERGLLADAGGARHAELITTCQSE